MLAQRTIMKERRKISKSDRALCRACFRNLDLQVQYLIKEQILCQILQFWFGGKKIGSFSHREFIKNQIRARIDLDTCMYMYCINLSIQEQPILDIMHKMQWFNWCERHTACQAERVIIWYSIFLAFSKMWEYRSPSLPLGLISL